jgi:hypothetical protein
LGSAFGPPTGPGWAALIGPGRPVGANAGRANPPPAPPDEDARTIGPGAGRGCAAGGKFSCRATTGVTPAVAALGRSGCWPRIGRACANCCAVTGRATACTGRDAIIAAAGTDVAAPRLTKLLMVMLFLVMFVTLLTWLTLTRRM